jgi:hypothetical protein
MISSGSSQRVWYVYFPPLPRSTDFTNPMQYNIGSAQGASFHGDKLRELPDPTPCRDEIIPDPDSIPLSILNHPLGGKNEIDFAAYDPPELTLSPAEGDDPMLALHPDSSFEVLTGE